jgi:lysophospholipase L1-like esterase
MKRSIYGILLFIAAILLFSCKEKDDPQTPDPIPSGLEIKGDAVEAAGAMVSVAEGVWDIYGQFKSGQITVSDSEGKEFVSIRVPAVKEGLCRLRVKSDKSYSLVRINKVSLVVTEGAEDNPKAGSKPPIEASYEGRGVWTVPKLYIGNDHIRYRFLLETDTPSELKYWCATWDNAGAQPSAYSAGYLKVRALGQDEYDALYLKDNRACWMFPESETDRLAAFRISMNEASPTQLVSFSTAHMGPKAVFIGDSITWQWGLASRDIAKSTIVIPMNPMPSWMKENGSNVTVYWHKDFFTKNDYVDMGVSANNTSQMVVRYQNDVLKRDPQCVVIMGGTNDLAQGVTKANILLNIKNMAEQADALNMKVVLCSVTPCNREYSALSNPKTKGAHIIELNRMIKEYADSKGFIYCDYFPVLVDTDGLSMQQRYWLYDDLHPNPDAYTVMEGVIKPIIESITE